MTQPSDPTPASPRPPRHGWARGDYWCLCDICKQRFIGAKRAYNCEACAYARPDVTLTLGMITAHVLHEHRQKYGYYPEDPKGALQLISWYRWLRRSYDRNAKKDLPK